MTTKNKLKLRFYLKSNKIDNSNCKIMLEITSGDDYYRVNLKKQIDGIDWDYRNECVKESAENSVELNLFLKFIKARICRLYNEINESKYRILAYRIWMEYLLETTISESWIEKDVKTEENVKIEPFSHNYLELYELNKVKNARISDEKTAVVRDVFLFCCFSKLNYYEIKRLTTEDIRVIDEKKYLGIKTFDSRGILYIPIISELNTIIEKYDNHPLRISEKVLIPVPEIEEVKMIVKTLGCICNVNKKLTRLLANYTYNVYTSGELSDIVCFTSTNNSILQYYEKFHHGRRFYKY